MGSRIYNIVFVFTACFVCLSISVILWNDHIEYQKVNSGKHALLRDADISTISQYSVEPIALSLQILSKNVGELPQSAILAETYLQRRPLDPRGWLWSSGFLQRQEKFTESIEHLKVAHALSKRNPFFLNQVLNRYLELGEIISATDVASDLSQVRPSYFRRLFSVMSRVTPNSQYRDLIQNMIPESLSDKSKFKPDYYFSTALNVARSAKNDELMDMVWSEMPSEFKIGSEQGLAYFNTVARRQDASRLLPIWGELTGNKIEVGQISNSSFENEIPLGSPCFASKNVSGVEWGRDQLAHEGEYSLKVSFNGEENVSLSHAQCPITLKSGASYAIDGVWTGKNISTLSGVYVDVVSPSIKGIYARTEAKIGRWPWQAFKLEFTVPDDIEVAIIRIRRKKTDFLDSKIAGDVWFDSLNLSPVVIN